MRVRLATENDYQSADYILNYIHNIHHLEKPIHFRKTTSFMTEESYIEMLQNENNKVFLLEAENKIIGICSVNIIKIEETHLINKRTILQIGNIGILPDYQRNGYGQILIDYVKNYNYKDKIDNIQLMVWDFNEKAINFYKKLGFTNRSLVMELMK